MLDPRTDDRCDRCEHWDNTRDIHDGRGDCRGIDVCGGGFENNGCGSDNIYQSLPGFYCANFIVLTSRGKRGKTS